MTGTESGNIIETILGELRNEKPDLLTSYVDDFFVGDYRRMKKAAEENDENTKFVLGLRSTGSRLFEVGEAKGQGNTMSGAVLDRERDVRAKHDWYLVEVLAEDEFSNGSQVYGDVRELGDFADARAILVEGYISEA